MNVQLDELKSKIVRELSQTLYTNEVLQLDDNITLVRNLLDELDAIKLGKRNASEELERFERKARDAIKSSHYGLRMHDGKEIHFINDSDKNFYIEIKSRRDRTYHSASAGFSMSSIAVEVVRDDPEYVTQGGHVQSGYSLEFQITSDEYLITVYVHDAGFHSKKTKVLTRLISKADMDIPNVLFLGADY